MSNFSPSQWKAKWHYLSANPAFRKSPIRTALRLPLWRAHCLLGTPATVELLQYGVRLFLPPCWRGISKLIYVFGTDYESELTYLGSVLSAGMVAVDAGANVGVYSTVCSRLVGSSGKVLSFEPAESAFKLLERNVRLNKGRNTKTFRFALSDRAGTARLYHHPDASRNSLGQNVGMQGTFEEVPTTTLDNVLDREDIARIDFLKIDVEGAEELVLRGAMKLLLKCRPIILFEVNPAAAGKLGLGGQGAWDLLAQRGYEFFAMAGIGELKPAASIPEGGNVLAIHPESCARSAETAG